ncbi:MAG TPA: tRNA dihydrouridine synthase DusB, partial [Chromatiaceae bacterium]|nr:tRNA dihydrouridine synthase DusB [Chromatiaceae bacterium]
ILDAVTGAVTVPVTLKIRTGWDTSHRNAVVIARIAEAYGIAALTVHGRTRACGFEGKAEYGTIARVKQAVDIPVIANGDIDSPLKAGQVMRKTGADGVMIGRAAQGQPWIFRQVASYFRTGRLPAPLEPEEIAGVIVGHIQELHRFYGPDQGVRIARKHIGWYLSRLAVPQQQWKPLLREESPLRQLDGLSRQLRRLRQAA